MAMKLVDGRMVPLTIAEHKAVFPGLHKKSKYRAKRCEWKGEKFDSKKEMLRHIVLLDMQRRGEISDLRRQPKYPLIVNDRKIATYIADWEYWLKGQGLVAEDAKGFAKIPAYVLKKKLFCALYLEIEHRES